MYKLLGDEKYLIKSFEKIQEALKKVDEDLKEVYLSYPVEKLIIAEYNKVLKKLIKSYRVSLPTQHPLLK